MASALELLLETSGERLFLRSSEVGLFTRALPQGALLAPGAPAGVLHTLGRRVDLLAPAGATGRVLNARPGPVLFPVGYGTRLYELAALGISPAAGRAETHVASASAELVYRAPCSGRFWHRPAPGDPAFVQPDGVLVEGQTLGLIEVMKTFTHLVYRAGGALPARARLVRFLAEDGAEVQDGAALLELEGV